MPRPDTAAASAAAASARRWLSPRSVLRASGLLLVAGILTAACGSSSPAATNTTTHPSTPPASGPSGNPSHTTVTTVPPVTTTTLPAPTSNLAIEAKIPLGLSWARSMPAPAAVEAPNGSVFVAAGSVVYVVEGNDAPVVAEHAGGPVLALAADATDLYVETGLVVTDYSRSTGNEVAHWTLSGAGTPTSAGLFAEPGVVYGWTDFATDASGFNYANLYRIVGGSVQPIDGSAYPGEMYADAAGLYFEAAVGTTVGAHLELVTPSGGVTVSPDVMQFGSPITVVDGQLVIEQPVTDRGDVWSTWDPTTLRRSSQTVTGIIYADPIAETGSGLLLMEVPSGSSVPSAAITETSPTTGQQLDGGVQFASNSQWLLQGYYPAVVNVEGGQLYLVRLT